jgi:hypothetical protein
VKRFVLEFGEDPRCLLRLTIESSRFSQCWSEDFFQSGVACKTKDEIHTVAFAPAHQPIATETGIGPQNDPHRRPSHADLGNDPLNFF